MPLLDNATCPVCNRVFEEGDDVVYCPECGTPHHRDCYKAVGHCVNRGLHASNFSYYDEIKAKQAPPKAEEGEKAEGLSSVFSNVKNEENSENAPSAPFIFPSASQFDSFYEKDDQKIGGESVADYAVTIRTNIPRFISLFKEFEYKGRKTSWNWGAFCFGSLYLFFRKMYKHAMAFMAAFVGVVYASCLAVIKLAPHYVEAAKNFAELYAQNKITNEDIEALSKISDISTVNIVIYAAFGVILILRIIMALYADKFYKSTISAFIKNVNSQLKDGASFIQNPIFPSQSEDMTQLQMKRYYLARRGGTSTFMPLMAALLIYFLMSIAVSTLFY